ncbi:MAG: hypothetical protein MHMPM18_002101 [Marteilia pararefringens]
MSLTLFTVLVASLVLQLPNASSDDRVDGFVQSYIANKCKPFSLDILFRIRPKHYDAQRKAFSNDSELKTKSMLARGKLPELPLSS